MSIFEWFGRGIATYLSQPLKGYAPLTTNDPATLAATRSRGRRAAGGRQHTLLQSHQDPDPVHLVPRLHLHRDALGPPADGSEPNILLEVDVLDGVRVVPLSMYARFHTRICRPVSFDP